MEVPVFNVSQVTRSIDPANSKAGSYAIVSSGRNCRYRYNIRLCPQGLSTTELNPNHGDGDFVFLDRDQQVVIVYVLALKRVAGTAFNWIRMCSSSPSDEISHAPVLVSFIIVHVASKNNETDVHVLLAFFKILRQQFLRWPCG